MSTSPRIGTAGWSYQHWKGVVYPKAYPPGFHPLEYLARRLNTVEINSSFYHPLKPEVVKLWMRKAQANPDFQFTAKLHQCFTHGRMLEEPSIAEFKEGLWPLLRARKLGAILMQFPWAFRFTPENREFLIRLDARFTNFRWWPRCGTPVGSRKRRSELSSTITSVSAISTSRNTPVPCRPRRI